MLCTHFAVHVSLLFELSEVKVKRCLVHHVRSKKNQSGVVLSVEKSKCIKKRKNIGMLELFLVSL
jgi:hypothetical protein